MHFDGINDQVTVGNVMPSTYTKEAWINIPSANSRLNNVISGNLGGQHAFWVPVSFSGSVYQISAGHNGLWTAVTDPAQISFGTWVHMAVTYDQSTQDMILYKNGIQVDQDLNVPPFLGGSELLVGAFENNFFFGGSIDEVRVWNVVRTGPQILASMNTELTGSEPGLVVYYNFNQGVCGGNNAGLSVPEVTDISGNNNHGTMINMAQTGCTSNFVCAGPTPCNYPSNNVLPPQIVPTLSQWGLIILSILLLTFGVVAIRARQVVLSGSQAESKMTIGQLPWNKSLFGKVLAAVALGFIAMFTLGIMFGGYELTSADVPGSLLTIPLLAYLIHAALAKA